MSKSVVEVNAYLCFMILQELILICLFSAAVVYLGYIVYKSFEAKSGCASGCGKCGIDFNKIERQLRKP
jgi:hypothetical protein